MRLLFTILIILTSTVLHAAPPEVSQAKEAQWNPVSVGSFAESIGSAVMKYKDKKAPYKRYAPEQIIHIAENILAGQNSDGGWPKNKDWLRIWTDKDISKLRGRSTFDNHSTWSQIDYLSRVYQQTKLKRYADSALKGIEYILKSQRKTGGWRGSDVDAITFNDDVMVGVMKILKAVAEDRKLYAFAEKDTLGRVKVAYEKALKCVLDCQIKVNGRLTAWCQQHDHKTLEPVWARAFEPPSIVTRESVGVVRFLMSIENPSPEIKKSIHAAVAWLDKVKIQGLRIEKVKKDATNFKYHHADYDNVEVKDENAPPIWTRYYALKTEKPIFCTRQRKVTSKYTDLSRERRTGYSWYGYYPATLLSKEYPKWQKKYSQ